MAWPIDAMYVSMPSQAIRVGWDVKQVRCNITMVDKRHDIGKV
jgi:hypothetical protein